jgi:hypothetical protein
VNAPVHENTMFGALLHRCAGRLAFLEKDGDQQPARCLSGKALSPLPRKRIIALESRIRRASVALDLLRSPSA